MLPSSARAYTCTGGLTALPHTATYVPSAATSLMEQVTRPGTAVALGAVACGSALEAARMLVLDGVLMVVVELKVQMKYLDFDLY